MPSEYLIQVVHKSTGQVVSWAPGLEVEKEFDTELFNRVHAKGLGWFRMHQWGRVRFPWFRRKHHVAADVSDAFRELLHDLKKQV